MQFNEAQQDYLLHKSDLSDFLILFRQLSVIGCRSLLGFTGARVAFLLDKEETFQNFILKLDEDLNLNAKDILIYLGTNHESVALMLFKALVRDVAEPYFKTLEQVCATLERQKMAREEQASRVKSCLKKVKNKAEVKKVNFNLDEKIEAKKEKEAGLNKPDYPKTRSETLSVKMLLASIGNKEAFAMLHVLYRLEAGKKQWWAPYWHGAGKKHQMLVSALSEELSSNPQGLALALNNKDSKLRLAVDYRRLPCIHFFNESKPSPTQSHALISRKINLSLPS